MNGGYPLPLVKGALTSGSIGEKGNPETFVLDGHNNPGFSGGPVVFRPANNPNGELRVMAIVSAYRTEDVDVMFQGEPTGLTHSTNTGIVVCPSIQASGGHDRSKSDRSGCCKLSIRLAIRE